MTESPLEMSLARLFAWQGRLALASLRAPRAGSLWPRTFFLLLGLAWLLSVGLGVYSVLDQALARSPDATWIPGFLLQMSWLGALAMTLFFNLGLLLHVIFYSPDLAFLMAAPINPRKILASRFVEGMWANVFFSLFLSFPATLAVGIRCGASWLYYGVYLLAFPGFLAIPVALTFLAGIPLARWVSTAGLRAAFSVFGFLAAVVLWSLPHFIPARVHSGRDWSAMLSTGLEIHGFLDSRAGWLLPSSWAAGALERALSGEPAGVAVRLAGLVGAALGLFLLSIAVGAGSYLNGWIRLRPVGATRQIRPERFSFLLAWLPASWRPIFWKDLSMVARDFRVSFQLFSLGALMCLFPFVSIMSQMTSEILDSTRSMLGFSTALGASVVVSSQAGMMSIPLEGRAGFRLLAAPLRPREVAAAKWLVSLLLSLPIVAAQMAIIALGFGRPMAEALMGGVVGLAGALVGSGFGVFMGVTFANFNWDHPKKMIRSGAQLGWGLGVGSIVVLLAMAVHLATLLGDSFASGLLKPLLPVFLLAGGILTSGLGVGLAARKFARLEWL